MDIMTGFGPVVGGSNPSGCTIDKFMIYHKFINIVLVIRTGVSETASAGERQTIRAGAVLDDTLGNDVSTC